MGKRQVGFGTTEEKPGVWDRFVGQYILIYTPHNKTFAGRLSRIEDDYGILNPFEGATWNGRRGLTRKLVNKDSIVFLPGTSIEPITERDLKAYCRYQNKKSDSDSKTKTQS